MSAWTSFRDVAEGAAAQYFNQYTGGVSTALYQAQRQHKAESDAHDRQVAADRAAQRQIDAENARYAAEQARFASQVDQINAPGADRVSPVLAPNSNTVFDLPPTYLIGGMAVVMLVAVVAARR